jgi:hypothetical protein
VNGDMEMNAQATKIQAAENNLKQLMADVTKAMEKAQEAVAQIAVNAAAAPAQTVAGSIVPQISVSRRGNRAALQTR